VQITDTLNERASYSSAINIWGNLDVACVQQDAETLCSPEGSHIQPGEEGIFLIITNTDGDRESFEDNPYLGNTIEIKTNSQEVTLADNTDELTVEVTDYILPQTGKSLFLQLTFGLTILLISCFKQTKGLQIKHK
jgi:hypothetical protein